MKTESIVLIGMAGAGKSTVGRLVAKSLRFRFIDGDDYINEKQGCPLQDTLDRLGDNGFMELEKDLMLEIDLSSHIVLAPGGSVVYYKDLMAHFKGNSLVAYLDDTIENIESRLPNAARRGIVGLKTKTLRQIYEERRPLYEQWADVKLRCDGKKPDELAEQLLQEFRKLKKQEKK